MSGHTTTLRRFASREIQPERTFGLRADHPAVVTGRTIFRKSVVSPDSGERLFVSGHNSPKIGAFVTIGDRAGFPIFHFTLEERATCPSGCHMWAGCYGNSMPYARRNSHDDPAALMRGMREELGTLQMQYPGGFLVRLHILGDFFSVEYVEAWGRWLRELPALHVFGYTRRERTDPIGAAVASMADRSWDRFAIRFSGEHAMAQAAIVVDVPSSNPAVIMCPAQSGGAECCGSCGLCWKASARGKAIGFLRHGMKRRGEARSSQMAKPELRVVPVEVKEDRRLVSLSPIRVGDITRAAIPLAPHMQWIAIEKLRINQSYQRNLSPTSMRLIRRVVANFDWARLKAVSVLDLGDGTYEVVDGQHTAIAALSHGDVPEVPCMVTSLRSNADAAAVFVDLNTSRVMLTPLQIFWAQVAAGNEIACDAAAGVAKAGGRIPRTSLSAVSFKPGDCIAIGALEKLAKDGGMPYVRRAMAIGVAAKLAPVRAEFLRSFREIIWGPHAGKITDERLVDIIRIHGGDRLRSDARRMQESSKHTIWRALTEVIVRLA